MFFCPDKPDISIHSTRVGGDGFFPYAMLYRDKISIHSTRVGGDLPGQRDDVVLPLNFNPLHPCGRRLSSHGTRCSFSRFQSTPPVWAETRPMLHALLSIIISIHSTRVGGDAAQGVWV